MRIVRITGTCLLAIGLALGGWAYLNFASLQNFARVGVLIPFAFGVPMFSIRDYGAGWAALSPREKGRAIAWLFAPFLISLAAVVWYLSDPAAKA